MAKTGIKLDLNWKKLRETLDPNGFRARASAQMKKATQTVGLHLIREVRNEMKSSPGKYDANKELTLMLKAPATKPLINKGQLFQAITYRVINAFTVFVGVLAKNEMYNVARTIHDGKKIAVSQKMRKLFYLLHLHSTGKKSKHSSLSGRAKQLMDEARGGEFFPIVRRTIVIPPRPWIENVLSSAKIQAKVTEVWMRTFQKLLSVKKKGD